LYLKPSVYGVYGKPFEVLFLLLLKTVISLL